MRTKDRVALLTPFVILGIALVFAYLVINLLSLLGPSAFDIAYTLSEVILFFFATLALFGLILALAMLSFWIRHLIFDEQNTYGTRRPQATQRPPANTRNNGY